MVGRQAIDLIDCHLTQAADASWPLTSLARIDAERTGTEHLMDREDTIVEDEYWLAIEQQWNERR